MAKKREISKLDILHEAQHLLQSRGCNGFSMRELAGEVGLTSASLHYHFATKDTLLAAIFAHYRDKLNRALAEMEAELEDWQQCEPAVETTWQKVVGPPPRICCLAIAAADATTLETLATEEARQLFENARGWLSRFALKAKSSHETGFPINGEGWLAQIIGSNLIRRWAS